MTVDPKKPCSCGSDCSCEPEVREQMNDELADVIRKSRAALCYECGKCSGICPVARYDSSFSPRSLLVRAVQGRG